MSAEDESFIKLECILFFQNNPDCIETAGTIARKMGHNVESVQQTLNILVEMNILEKVGEPNYEFYRYREAFSATKINLIG
jgi:hypothetical protein